MTRRYRIVRDKWSGFEVQWTAWWLPFWVQAGGCNTCSSLESAEDFAQRHAREGGIVKDLGVL